MPEAIACICCGGTRSLPHFKGLLGCQDCGHVWADMRLSDEELQRLYSRDYFQGEEYLDYEKEAPALYRNFADRIKELSAHFPPKSTLWEIGAAYGYFLQAASKYFQAAGCDISDHAASFAREKLGLEVQAADYLSLAPPPRPFDIVCMWDTVEHLRSPESYIAKAFSELKSGGLLAVSTGDIGSLAARIRGPKWRLIHPPTHLHYFTANSLATLLCRVGFRQVRVKHPAFWRSADAVAFRLLAYPHEKVTTPIYLALRKAGILGYCFPFNLGDLMTVYAIK